jgi:hypothetical protein
MSDVLPPESHRPCERVIEVDQRARAAHRRIDRIDESEARRLTSDEQARLRLADEDAKLRERVASLERGLDDGLDAIVARLDRIDRRLGNGGVGRPPWWVWVILSMLGLLGGSEGVTALLTS